MTQARLLGGRYELGGPIGLGGMAEVFRGVDVRLGRDVAVKVLRADLARDPSFQARFRREAQSAASLNAPSIVSVYDTGEDVGLGAASGGASGGAQVPYIVMEFVDGRTLRDVLKAEGRLMPQRALEVTADVLSALEVAHNAGIVHRDIKPGNVMLTPTGEIKVMDFGIARAVADSSSTMTQTAAVIGTAAYLSPEQARGEPVDARSDIYSTGCLLYELITGGPPFTGDSPVAVAYQHVREDPVPPSERDPSLSPDVDSVVLMAMAKNPDNRYQSAADMRADLLRAAAGERVAAAPVQRSRGSAAVQTATVLRPAGPNRRRRAGIAALFVVVLLAVLVGVGLLVRNLVGGGSNLVPAPALLGLSQEVATQRLTDVGLRTGEVTMRFDERPAGTVIGQSPDAQIVVRKGGKVDLVVSEGIEMTLVPQVIGQSQPEAEAILDDAKLTVDRVVQRDGNIAAGVVLDTLPRPGVQVRAGSGVTLVVSSGRLQVPDVRGRTRDDAEAALRRAGFSVTVESRDSRGAPGRVIDQRPVDASANRGSTVVIVLSRTPRPPSPSPSSVSPTPSPSAASPSPSPSPSPSATAKPTARPSASPSASPTR